MLAKLFRLTTFVAVTLAAWDLASNSFTRSWAEETAKPQAEAAAKPAKSAPAAPIPAGGPVASPGAFNYYVQPGVAGPLGAQLYVSPRPTPTSPTRPWRLTSSSTTTIGSTTPTTLAVVGLGPAPGGIEAGIGD
jgi:hypothetical protein